MGTYTFKKVGNRVKFKSVGAYHSVPGERVSIDLQNNIISFAGGVSYNINPATDTVIIDDTTHAPNSISADDLYDALLQLFPDANSGSGGSGASKSVANYAALNAESLPSQVTLFKVANDEDKGQTNTIYQLWPDGTRVWLAAVADR